MSGVVDLEINEQPKCKNYASFILNEQKEVICNTTDQPQKLHAIYDGQEKMEVLIVVSQLKNISKIQLDLIIKEQQGVYVPYPLMSKISIRRNGQWLYCEPDAFDVAMNLNSDARRVELKFSFEAGEGANKTVVEEGNLSVRVEHY